MGPWYMVVLFWGNVAFIIFNVLYRGVLRGLLPVWLTVKLGKPSPLWLHILFALLLAPFAYPLH